MKELLILFSGPMVEAILEGRKIQTRRTAGLEVVNENPDAWAYPLFDKTDPLTFYLFRSKEDSEVFGAKPRYRVGDHLWVKETYQDWCPHWKGMWCGCGSKEMQQELHGVIYRADNFVRPPSFNAEAMLKNLPPLKWKSGRFMFKKFARLWLEVTEVRPQRLQEISREDAVAEGIFVNKMCYGQDTADFPLRYNAADAFADLWDSINGKTHPWESNPYVWAYTFKRLEVKP